MNERLIAEFLENWESEPLILKSDALTILCHPKKKRYLEKKFHILLDTLRQLRVESKE